MRAALLGRALLFLSMALVGGLALPGRLRAGAIRGEAELERARTQRAETLARSQRAPVAVAAMADATPSERVRRVRRTLLEALEGLALDDVRLEVRESRQTAGSVDVQLAAQGRFVDLVSATTRLVEPKRGLALATLRLQPRQEHAQLELEAQCR